jgi:hypothetical protein
MSSASGSLTFFHVDQAVSIGPDLLTAAETRSWYTHRYLHHESLYKRIIFCKIRQYFLVRRDIDEDCESIFRDFLVSFSKTMPEFDMLEPYY